MLTTSLPMHSKSTLRPGCARSWHFKPSHTATPLKRALSISLRGPCIRSSRLVREFQKVTFGDGHVYVMVLVTRHAS